MPGPNVVRAYAEDEAGNRSVTNSVSMTYVVSWPLGVEITGQGTVTPKDGTVLELGKPVTAAATPKPGWLLTNWTVERAGIPLSVARTETATDPSSDGIQLSLPVLGSIFIPFGVSPSNSKETI